MGASPLILCHTKKPIQKLPPGRFFRLAGIHKPLRLAPASAGPWQTSGQASTGTMIPWQSGSNIAPGNPLVSLITPLVEERNWSQSKRSNVPESWPTLWTSSTKHPKHTFAASETFPSHKSSPPQREFKLIQTLDNHAASKVERLGKQFNRELLEVGRGNKVISAFLPMVWPRSGETSNSHCWTLRPISTTVDPTRSHKLFSLPRKNGKKGSHGHCGLGSKEGGPGLQNWPGHLVRVVAPRLEKTSPGCWHLLSQMHLQWRHGSDSLSPGSLPL